MNDDVRIIMVFGCRIPHPNYFGVKNDAIVYFHDSNNIRKLIIYNNFIENIENIDYICIAYDIYRTKLLNGWVPMNADDIKETTGVSNFRDEVAYEPLHPEYIKKYNIKNFCCNIF